MKIDREARTAARAELSRKATALTLAAYLDDDEALDQAIRSFPDLAKAAGYVGDATARFALRVDEIQAEFCMGRKKAIQLAVSTFPNLARKAGVKPADDVDDDDLQDVSDEIVDPDLDDEDDDDDDDDEDDELEAGNEDTKNEKMKTKSEIELARLAAERQRKSGGSYAETYRAVLTQNPQLYAAYRKEHRAMIAKAEASA